MRCSGFLKDRRNYKILMIFKLSLFQVIGSFVIFLLFLILAVALTILLERKILSSIQRRKGPNIVGIFGFLQPIADAIKAILKEIVFPRDADIYVFLLAPMFTLFCSFKLWSAIPFDQFDYPIAVTHGILYLLVIMSFSAYGLIFAGWSSNSKYAFLGGLRSTAQMISYEVCLSFIFLIIVMLGQTLDLKEIVDIQTNCWFILPLFPLWFMFMICALAETNRAPFDLPEAEAELVAGYGVEYSALPFAMFFLSEYSNIIFMSALSSLFFWGGWLPLISVSFIPGYIWFILKIVIHIFIFIWVRGTFPRYRYDQLMKLGWKILLPLTLCFLFCVNFTFIHMDKYCAFIY